MLQSEKERLRKRSLAPNIRLSAVPGVACRRMSTPTNGEFVAALQDLDRKGAVPEKMPKRKTFGEEACVKNWELPGAGKVGNRRDNDNRCPFLPTPARDKFPPPSTAKRRDRPIIPPLRIGTIRPKPITPRPPLVGHIASMKVQSEVLQPQQKKECFKSWRKDVADQQHVEHQRRKIGMIFTKP